MMGTTRRTAGALLSVAGLLGGCGSPASITNTSAAVASIGREVHDGNFAFTVTRFDSHLPRIRGHIPKGEFVAVIITVKNIGGHPETYVAANQKLKDINGETYSPDEAVDATLNDQFSPDINPGYQVEMGSVFDVPPGTVPASVELHDSESSAGVAVNLSY
jgi:hypothetical protein